MVAGLHGVSGATVLCLAVEDLEAARELVTILNQCLTVKPVKTINGTTRRVMSLTVHVRFSCGFYTHNHSQIWLYNNLLFIAICLSQQLNG